MLDDIDVASLHIESMGLILGRDVIIHGVTILTLILLWISYTLKLTWPVSTEQFLMIFIIWGWIGNIVHSNFVILHSPCDAQPTMNETVIVASDVASSNNGFQITPCGWNLFNIYFSALCIFSSLMSFMSETQSYCLSFLFKTLSVLSTVFIFLLPIACNRFRFASTAILILKITLYNLAWNMNRFLGDTQIDIISNYSKGDMIMKGYESIYRDLVHPQQRRRDERDPHYREEKQPNNRRRYYDEDDEDDEEDEDEDYDTEEEEDYDSYHNSLRYSKKKRNPSSVLKSLEKTNSMIKKVNLPRRIPRNQEILQSRDEQQIPLQMTHFNQLYKINKRNRPSCFWSWKYRGYDDRISDTVRVVWVLAICPFYLFTVVLFLIGLGYYIRKTTIELDATRKIVTAMEKIIK